MLYQKQISLDVSGIGEYVVVTAKQGDKEARSIKCSITEDGQAMELPSTVSAKIAFRKPDGKQVLNDAVIENNTVTFSLTQQMLIAAGSARCEILLFEGDELLSTAVFEVFIYPTSYNPDDIESEPEYQTFIEALQSVNSAVAECQEASAQAEQAGDYANTQGDSAARAGQEAAQAATAAQTATTAADSAAQDASLAADSASAAAQQAEAAADRANTAAETIENTDIGDLAYRIAATCSTISGDLNAVVHTGWYSGSNATTSNHPNQSISESFVLSVFAIGDGAIVQDIYYSLSSPQRYTRSYAKQSNGTFIWQGWKRIPVDVTINGKQMVGNVQLTAGDVGAAPASSILVGEVKLYAGTALPVGFLFCDGSAVSRSVYADLYNAIGTYYGIGDGSTTFNLPNLSGRTVVGRNSSDSDFSQVGKMGGSKQSDYDFNHDHLVGKQINTSDFAGGTGVIANGTNFTGDSTTGDTPLSNKTISHLQPYTVLNYIIKY